MPRVFISYAWKDGRNLAEYLYQHFNARDGWSAWMDRDLTPDRGWSHEIQMELDAATVVVVVVSPNVNRPYPASFVIKELSYAFDKHVNKPVFVAKAHDCQAPVLVADLTFHEFFPETRRAEAFDKLVNAIQRNPRGEVIDPTTRREHELAYLSKVAKDNSFWGKVYVAPSARATHPVEPPPTPPTDEVAAYLDSLLAAVHPAQQHSPTDATRHTQTETYDALSVALGKFERVAVIGDPGSGKTTTLRRFAYDLAQQAVDDETAPLPLFVPLGGYTGGDFAAYVEQHFAPLRLSDYWPKRVVLLLDGLNETAHSHIPTIEAWLKQHPTTRVMLTCRKLDYVERELDLQRVDVLPLDMPRIRDMMAAYKLSAEAIEDLFWGLVPESLREIWRVWSGEGSTFEDFWWGEGIASRTSGTQDNELKAVRAKLREGHYPGLLGLACNPFLLTITIALYKQSAKVPRNRGQLFGDFARHLLEQRGRPAAIVRPPWIEAEQQQVALAQLAYKMQIERKTTRVERAWARGVVAEALPTHDPDHVLYLGASAGILDLSDTVTFTHQLLQEYYAAHQLDVERHHLPATHFWQAEKWWEPTGWEETAILLAGLYNDDCTPIVEWLQDANPVLAARCILESGAYTKEATIKTLQPRWLPRLTDVTGEPDARSRAGVGRGLALLDLDNRKGVGLNADGLPDIDWVEIPAGEYIYGSDKDNDPQVYDDESPQRTLTNGTFYISRYPITYRQFQAFVDAPDGFHDPRWWEGLAERETTVGDQAFKYWNHPRERVSWYDAMAFCRWWSWRLTGDVPRMDVPLTWPVRLPTEFEWERAARGTKGLIYPYGNDFDAAKGNTDATGIGMTSAVGIFPHGASVEGVQDMSGNVWEWCLTEYSEPSRDIDITNNSPRVARGGSWFTFQDHARAAYRNDNYFPLNRDYDWGFRAVVSAPILGALVSGA